MYSIDLIAVTVLVTAISAQTHNNLSTENFGLCQTNFSTTYIPAYPQYNFTRDYPRLAFGFLTYDDEYALINAWESNNETYEIAKLYLSYYANEDGRRLYGGEGYRCGFAPYLMCSSRVGDPDSALYPWRVLENNTIAFGQAQETTFWRCNNQENNADQYYPPLGVMGSDYEYPSYGACQPVTLYSDVCGGTRTGYNSWGQDMPKDIWPQLQEGATDVEDDVGSSETSAGTSSKEPLWLSRILSMSVLFLTFTWA